MVKTFQQEQENLDIAYCRLGGQGTTQQTVHLLVENYSRRSRFYHNQKHREYMAAPLSAALLAHLGNINPRQAEQLNAYCCIIGTAHDSQYIEVDGGLNDTAAEILFPYVELSGGRVYLRPKLPVNLPVQMLVQLFNIQAGEDLTSLRIHNEALSALAVALDMEHAGVPYAAIARVMQGVAGTIPFREADYMMQLDERLKHLNTLYSFGLTEEDVRHSLLLTTDLANRDVASFCDTDLGAFVTGTMELIPEQLAQVRQGATARQFLESLQWSLGFFMAITEGRGVVVEHIFHTAGIGDFPGEVWHRQATEQARRNIFACTHYLQCKVVSAALLASVATLINEEDALLLELVDGGDYAGVLQGRQAQLNSEEQRILSALESRGHGNIGRYDIDGSPIAKIMLEKLGSAAMVDIFQQVNGKNFSDPADAKVFYEVVRDVLGKENLIAILQVLAEIALNPAAGKHGDVNHRRAEALRKLSVIS